MHRLYRSIRVSPGFILETFSKSLGFSGFLSRSLNPGSTPKFPLRFFNYQRVCSYFSPHSADSKPFVNVTVTPFRTPHSDGYVGYIRIFSKICIQHISIFCCAAIRSLSSRLLHLAFSSSNCSHFHNVTPRRYYASRTTRTRGIHYRLMAHQWSGLSTFWTRV